ncbi:MAG: hypothetical protein ACOH2I_03410 [Pseudomonas sp.]
MSSLAGLALTGCLSGGGGDSNDGGAGGGGDSGAGTTSFTVLIKDIFANTSDTAAPVATNGLAVTFDDQENDGAFDDLLGEP